MSETSSEKQLEDTTSLDEDSGHDSVDEISSERERIACLETAVNWIRDEVTQLKDYDRDILQELWRIRNTIHSIKDVHKKVRREESRFLDETVEDRSPTPDSMIGTFPEQKREKQQKPELEPDRSSVISPKSNDESPPLSPVQSPEFMNSEGDVYKTGTLQLMATAPNHLKKSSDEKLLEEFFGSDQVNKFSIFQSQTSLDTVNESGGDGGTSEKDDQGRMAQGVSMPNIATAPLNSPLTTRTQKQSLQQQGSPYQQYEPNQQQVQRRLLVPKNPQGDANRVSYDVVSEMEKLRARLQETAMQELAEFDRKYSPKFFHAGSINDGGSAGSIDGSRKSGDVSLNHSRQGSLDSSMSSQPTSNTNLINPGSSTRSRMASQGVGGGHTRQYSLPIDPNYYRQLQKEQSNDRTPPNMSPRAMRTTGIVIGRKISSSSHTSPSTNNVRSPSPPLVGHVRQVSATSVSSSENGTISPPLVIGSGFQLPEGMGRYADGGDPKHQVKQSKPPGLTRVPSNGSTPSHQHSSSYSLSSSAGISTYNSNGNNRHSPEAQFVARSHTVSQTHYSTGALKRGKRNSGEIMADQVGTYQSHVYQQPQQQQQQQVSNTTRPLIKAQSYDEKVRAGYRPHAYEKLPVRGQGDAGNQENRGGLAAATAGYQEGGGRPSLHPRSDTSKIPASPRLGRTSAGSGQGTAYSNGKVISEDIQPYMTSAQLKQQMKFSYTPFSSHQQQQHQRAYTVSSADPPRLQKKGGGRNTDQRTWI